MVAYNNGKIESIFRVMSPPAHSSIQNISSNNIKKALTINSGKSS
jgi:hypothetical protein